MNNNPIYSAAKTQLGRMNVLTKQDKHEALNELCQGLGFDFIATSGWFSKPRIEVKNSPLTNDHKLDLLNHLKKCHVAINTFNNNYADLVKQTIKLFNSFPQWQDSIMQNPIMSSRAEVLARKFLALVSLRNHGKWFENHNAYSDFSAKLKDALQAHLEKAEPKLKQQIQSRTSVKQDLRSNEVHKVPLLSYVELANRFKAQTIQLTPAEFRNIADKYNSLLDTKMAVSRREYSNGKKQQSLARNYIFGRKDELRAAEFAEKQLTAGEQRALAALRECYGA